MKDERWEILINYLRENRKGDYFKLLQIVMPNISSLCSKKVVRENVSLKNALLSLAQDYGLDVDIQNDTFLLLSDDWTDSAPAKINICGSVYLARTWYHVVLYICVFLYDLNPECFLGIIRRKGNCGEITSNITQNPSRTRQYLYDKIMNVYIAKDIQANTAKNIITQLLDEMGLLHEFCNIRLYLKIKDAPVDTESITKRTVKELEPGEIVINPINRKTCPLCKRSLKRRRLLYKKPNQEDIYPIWVQMCPKCQAHYMSSHIYEDMKNDGIDINKMVFLDTSQDAE